MVASPADAGPAAHRSEPLQHNSAWMQTHPHQLASNPNLTRWQHLLDVAALNASAINCGIARQSPATAQAFSLLQSPAVQTTFYMPKLYLVAA